MIKTKKILIALAVIGANMLHTMPVYTSLAAEADYTITQGSNTIEDNSGSYDSEIAGNVKLGTTILNDINMLIRSGTYNDNSTYKCIYLVKYAAGGGVDISNNSLNILDGTFRKTVYGVYNGDHYDSTPGTFNNNIVTISGGNFESGVYAALAKYGEMKENILTIEGGTFEEGSIYDIYTGYVEVSGNAISNKTFINGGNFKKYKDIYGGYVGSGNVIGNIVTINAGTFSDTDGRFSIHGGYSNGGGYNVDKGNVTKNIVNINGGTYDIACSTYGGYLGGTSDYGSISENEVNVSGGTFNAKMSFYGGSLPRSDLNAVSIEKNKVTIKNVTLENGSEIYGGQSSKVKIDSNIVTIDSGTFNNVLIVGGKSETAEVLNNSVVLNGGNFTGGTKIVAGIGVNDSAKFSGNSISLVGSNALDLSGASLMGFDGTDAGIANSTLKVGRANVKVQDIKNFGTISFDLNGVSSDAVVLKMGAAGTAYNLSNLGLATISVSGITLNNDFIVLMQNVNDGSFAGTVDDGGKGGAIKVLTTTSGYDLIYYVGTEPTAPKADYTITQGSSKREGNSGTYTSEIAGNTELSTTDLSDINMVVRRGTYENTIYGVKYEVDDSSTVISNNKVTIHDGSFKAVYGAYAKNGQVTGNILTIEDGTFGESYHIYAGYVDQNGKVEANKLIINGGDIGMSKRIYAGYIGGVGNAIDNEIFITGGTIGGTNHIHIYGADVNNGSATRNKVNISGAWVGKYATIYGGYAKTDSADYNVVKIENTTVGADCTVYGGNSYYDNGTSHSGKEAKYNRVEILDGVTMTDESSVFKEVVGGCGTYEVSNNTVLIKSGTYQAVAGGVNYSSSGPWEFGVSNNSVKMTGGTLVGGTSTIWSGLGDYDYGADGHIYGGLSGTNGTGVSNNSVELDGVTIKDSVKIYGGCATNFSPTSAFANSVTVANLQCEANKYSTIYGGYSNNISSYENTVTIKSGAWEKVYGGWGKTGAESNTVIIEGGSFKTNGTIYGGYGNDGTVGGDSEDKGNKVIINTTGTVDSNIFGGWSNLSGIAGYNKVIIESGTFSKNIVGGRGAANAENNEVTISGGTFNGSNQYIYGGWASNGNAIDNIVNIEGGTFTNGFKLYGGQAGSGNISSGNTLNLKIKMTGKASEVKYFQNMNFTLPSGTDDGTPMLKTQTVTFDDTTINVDASLATLSDGQIITLIAADNVPTVTYIPGTITGVGEAIITLDDKNLILKIITAASGGDEDQQKAPVEGIAAAVQTVNMSADLASGDGMKSLIAETAGGVTNTFGALTTGQSKYKTGSHVDVDGWGILVGAGKTKEWGNGEATSLGVFFEYGKGDFDTYNGNVHGDGNSKNQGIGFMMRHKMMNNTYYEGNIRYGKQSTEWGESEIGSYDTDSRYYGISVGMGHIYQAGKNEIDVYGRYTYGHVGACDATVGTSEYHFDSVKSHRVRVGGKYNFKQKNSNAKPYVGIAWEHEFKGETRATISGVGEAPAPSMKGNTGILEVGCDWNVSKKWTVGLGANAYVGKRKGWDGMARIFYNF